MRFSRTFLFGWRTQVVNPQLGTKRTCTTCGARFYDLNKSPIICPKCGAENDKDAVKSKRGGKGSKNDASKKVVPSKAARDEEDEEDLDDALLETDDDGDDGDLMEDTSDLGEDDDDMAEVMDHLETNDDDDR
jgi:uncharacterized protein (TIGR02300 family)